MKITRYSTLEAELSGVIRTANPSLAGVVLERLDNGEVLPIFVGMLETDSCFLGLARIVPPRPRSHDLAKNLLDVLGGKIVRVVVTDLREDSYYAVIRFLDKGGVEYEIDSRSSDAIARALRFDCPIFAEEQVFMKYAQQRGKKKKIAAHRSKTWNHPAVRNHNRRFPLQSHDLFYTSHWWTTSKLLIGSKNLLNGMAGGRC